MESTVSKRVKSNIALLKILENYLKDNPDIRFSQALSNLGLVRTIRPVKPDSPIDWVNEYYMEPDQILDRVVRRQHG